MNCAVADDSWLLDVASVLCTSSQLASSDSEFDSSIRFSGSSAGRDGDLASELVTARRRQTPAADRQSHVTSVYTRAS